VRQDAFENALRVAVTEVQLLKGKVEGIDHTLGNIDYQLAELGRSVDFKLDLLAKASSQRKALDSDSRLAVKAQHFSGRHQTGETSRSSSSPRSARTTRGPSS